MVAALLALLCVQEPVDVEGQPLAAQVERLRPQLVPALLTQMRVRQVVQLKLPATKADQAALATPRRSPVASTPLGPCALTEVRAAADVIRVFVRKGPRQSACDTRRRDTD